MKSRNNLWGETIEILLVEDNPGDAYLIRSTLNSTLTKRFNINQVTDGEAAMNFLRREGEYFQANLPDLVLLDWYIPKKNGLEVLTEIRADEDLKNLTVIVISSQTQINAIVKDVKALANGYLDKTYNLNKWIMTFRSIFLVVFFNSVKLLDYVRS